MIGLATLCGRRARGRVGARVGLGLGLVRPRVSYGAHTLRRLHVRAGRLQARELLVRVSVRVRVSMRVKVLGLA